MSDDPVDPDKPTFSVTVYGKAPPPPTFWQKVGTVGWFLLKKSWELNPLVQPILLTYQVVRHPLDTLDSLGYHFFALAACTTGAADCSSPQAKVDAVIGAIQLIPIPAGELEGVVVGAAEREALMIRCPSCTGEAVVDAEVAAAERAAAERAAQQAAEDEAALAKPGGLGKTEAQLQSAALRVKAAPIDAAAVARARAHLSSRGFSKEFAATRLNVKAFERLEAYLENKGPLLDADARLVRHEVLENELMNGTTSTGPGAGGMPYREAHEAALRLLGDKPSDLFAPGALDSENMMMGEDGRLRSKPP